MMTPKLLSTDSLETLEMNVWLAAYTVSASRSAYSEKHEFDAEMAVKNFRKFFNLEEKE